MNQDYPHLFQLLTPSRKRPHPGDIFVMKTDKGYLFGRVVSTDAKWGYSPETKGVNLVYVYRGLYPHSRPVPFERLMPEKLLFPPIMTNNLGWSRGYFETVANIPLTPTDTLSVHCFKDSHGNYYDEDGRRLKAPTKIVGMLGLDSYLNVEERVGEVLSDERKSKSVNSSLQ